MSGNPVNGGAEQSKKGNATDRLNDLMRFLVLEFWSEYYRVPSSKLIWLLFGMESLGPDRLSNDEKKRLSKAGNDYASLTKQLQEQVQEANKTAGLDDKEKAIRLKKILNDARGSIGVPANEDILDSFVTAAF